MPVKFGMSGKDDETTIEGNRFCQYTEGNLLLIDGLGIRD